jgi:hypothetical protein
MTYFRRGLMSVVSALACCMLPCSVRKDIDYQIGVTRKMREIVCAKREAAGKR